MQGAATVDGNKVTVELELGQISAIVASELEGCIQETEADIRKNRYIHPDDKEYYEKFLPALYLVYAHYAGEARAEELRQEEAYKTGVAELEEPTRIEFVAFDEETNTVSLDVNEKGKQLLIERGFAAILQEGLNKLYPVEGGENEQET